MRARTATFISALALASTTIGTGTALADAQCPDADAVPGAVADAVIQQATLCLLNEQRAAAGEVALVAQSQLEAAATAYSQKMVAGQFFSHVAPDGSTMQQRITSTQYLAQYGGWVIGENIGWGTGSFATPASMVTAWMNSTEHRENILDGRYREIGIGIAAGAPVPASTPGATYTTEFGLRTGLKPVTPAANAASAARSTTTVGTSLAAGSTVGSTVTVGTSTKKAKAAKKAKRAKRARAARRYARTSHRA